MRQVRLLVFPALLLLAPLAHCSANEGTSSTNDAGSGAQVIDAPSDTADGAPHLDADILAPTTPEPLATSPGKDEDPTVIRAADGTFYVAWYSNRDGNHRIYLKSSINGRDWSEDRVITPASEAHFYPSLVQSTDGRFHLVTWRGSLSDAGAIVGSIEYRSSANTLNWESATALTDSSALAWTPTITERAPGELHVAWSSDVGGDKDIYVTSSSDGGATWATSSVRLSDSAFNDDIPFITTRADGSLAMIWQRYDTSANAPEAPFTHPSNELVYATSPDGKLWSAPISITSDPPAQPIPDVISTLYPSTDPTGWSVAWSSARGASGSGDISSIGLSKTPATTSNVTQLTDAPGNDYSPRLTPAGPQGLYLMAWVSDRGGIVDGGPNLDIYHQLVRP